MFDAVVEMICIVATVMPSPVSSQILHTLTGFALTPMTVFTPSLPWLLGTTFVIGGSLLRLWVYRALGRLFTFQLAVLKNHRLVTTGPFAFVRHPSYTRLTAAFWGTALASCARSLWARRVLIDSQGFSSSLGWLIGARVLGGTVLALQTIANVGIVKRTRLEDDMLKRVFGKEWEEWAQRTPYYGYDTFVTSSLT
jgi:protein-S-isoprenylcysteine O-methyltransferase Ste14